MPRLLREVVLSAAVAAIISVAAVVSISHLFPGLTPAFPAQKITEHSRGAAPGPQPLPAETANEAGSVVPANSASSAPIGPKNEEPWWARLIGKVIWPATLIFALAFIAFNSRLRRLFGTGSRLVRKINAAGVEMEISSEAVDEVRQQLRGSFRELVESARDEYERMADLQNVGDRLAAVIDKELVPALSDNRPSGLRATVHVRDIIFRDYLYQLTDYHPAGAGAHRRFSQRYGIIGRSWRTGTSHGTGNAFGSSASEESLVEEWGMTKEETHGVLHNRPSCLSILLRADGIDVGILYVDSADRNAFGADPAAQAFALSFEGNASVAKLADAVGRTLAPLRAAGPNLDLKEIG